MSENNHTPEEERAFDAMLAHAASSASERAAEDQRVMTAVDRIASSARRRLFEAWMDVHATEHPMEASLIAGGESPSDWLAASLVGMHTLSQSHTSV